MALGDLAQARVLLVGFRAERAALQDALASWGALPTVAPTLEQGVARLVADISLAKPYSALLYASAEDLKLAQRFRGAAPNPVPPTILAVPREADVRRFDVLSSGFAAVPRACRSTSGACSTCCTRWLPGKTVRRRGATRTSAPRPCGQEAARARRRRQSHEPRGSRQDPGTQRPHRRARERRRAGADAIERHTYDIVLLDRNMPGMGGMEALGALRLMTRGRERLPVIMLSADVTTEAKREALEAGADVFLPKPIEAIRLLEELQRLASGARRARNDRGSRVRAAPAAAEPVANAETLAHLEELGALLFVERLIRVFLADSATPSSASKALAGRDYPEFRSLMHARKARRRASALTA